MSERHTPGPWKIGPKFDEAFVVIESQSAFIARTLGGNDAANAYLIAAAPDLLEALDADDEFFKHYTECLHCGPGARFCPKAIVLCAAAETKRKAAIAKARGEQ